MPARVDEAETMMMRWKEFQADMKPPGLYMV